MAEVVCREAAQDVEGQAKVCWGGGGWLRVEVERLKGLVEEASFEVEGGPRLNSRLGRLKVCGQVENPGQVEADYVVSL